MTASAFIDSGAFIALLDRKDRRHAEVEALFAIPPRRLYTSRFVVAETHGWFLHRLGEDAARAFLALLSSLPTLALLPVADEHHGAVIETLEALRGRKLTYVDASSLVYLRERRIGTVWGCDSDLGLQGARVVPGAPD